LLGRAGARLSRRWYLGFEFNGVRITSCHAGAWRSQGVASISALDRLTILTIFLVMIITHSLANSHTDTHSIADAKAHLAEYVAAAEAGGRLVLTRHGKPVAALVPVADLTRLQQLRDGDPMAGLAGLIGAWEEDDEGDEAVAQVIASRTPGRALPDFGDL
jgi:prevent-host-death family protein